MRYVRLGSSGLKVSRIGLGMMSYGDPAAETWFLSEDAAEPIVRHAVGAGVNFFDTADMYSGGVSEEVTGRLLGKLFARRGDYVIPLSAGGAARGSTSSGSSRIRPRPRPRRETTGGGATGIHRRGRGGDPGRPGRSPERPEPRPIRCPTVRSRGTSYPELAAAPRSGTRG
jgi:Aldo/keto reductase family